MQLFGQNCHLIRHIFGVHISHVGLSIPIALVYPMLFEKEKGHKSRWNAGQYGVSEPSRHLLVNKTVKQLLVSCSGKRLNHIFLGWEWIYDTHSSLCNTQLFHCTVCTIHCTLCVIHCNVHILYSTVFRPNWMDGGYLCVRFSSQFSISLIGVLFRVLLEFCEKSWKRETAKKGTIFLTFSKHITDSLH